MSPKPAIQEQNMGYRNSDDSPPQSPQDEVAATSELSRPGSEPGAQALEQRPESPFGCVAVEKSNETIFPYETPGYTNSMGQETSIPQPSPQPPSEAELEHHYANYAPFTTQNAFSTCLTVPGYGVPSPEFPPTTNVPQGLPSSTERQPPVTFHRDRNPPRTPPSSARANRPRTRSQGESRAENSPSRFQHYHPYARTNRQARSSSLVSSDTFYNQRSPEHTPTSNADSLPSGHWTRVLPRRDGNHNTSVNLPATSPPSGDWQLVDYSSSSSSSDEPSVGNPRASSRSPRQVIVTEPYTTTEDQPDLQEVLNSITEIESTFSRVKARLASITGSPDLFGPDT